jgi:hypothetical protein
MGKKLKPIGTSELEKRLTKLEENFTKALNDKSSNLTIFLDEIQILNKLLDTLFPNRTLKKRNQLPAIEPKKYSTTSTRVKAAGYQPKPELELEVTPPEPQKSITPEPSLTNQLKSLIRNITLKKETLKNFTSNKISKIISEKEKELEKLINESRKIVEKGPPKQLNTNYKNALSRYKNAQDALNMYTRQQKNLR